MLKKVGLVAVMAVCAATSTASYAKDVRPAAINFQAPVAANANQVVNDGPARVRVAKRHDFLGLVGLPLVLAVGATAAVVATVAVVSTDGSSPS